MPRCANCGKVNKDGSLFCQDCGQKIDAPPVAAAPSVRSGAQLAAPPAHAPAAQAADVPTCPACGAVNPHGMSFCKMCGTSILARPAAAAGPSAASAVSPSGMIAPSPGQAGPKLACAACGKQTPSGFTFCQHCGYKLVVPDPAAGNQAGRPLGLAPTMAAPSAVLQAMAQAPAISPITARDLNRHGRLVVIRRDGSDGDEHILLGKSFDIGRVDGSLLFPEDPFLAPRHAHFSFGDGAVRVRSFDRVNGIYLRLRGGCDLLQGDQIVIGKEVLRFEPLAPEECDPPSLVEHGVRLLGTVAREAWGRLRQITGSGTTRDVWHLVRPELVLGREEGDVTFPDDEYLSRRHAAIRRASQKPGGAWSARLEDLNSSNGTFIRLRGEHELRAGDVLRLGDQLVRLEV
ncbi:MAG: FHA domain-containing protein [Myxococcales bacterium]|nr:FHA domain-containing protein [Myxococcales bacterium]